MHQILANIIMSFVRQIIIFKHFENELIIWPSILQNGFTKHDSTILKTFVSQIGLMAPLRLKSCSHIKQMGFGGPENQSNIFTHKKCLLV